MTKIAFIGTERIVRVFKYFGTAVFLVSTPREAGEKLQELVDDKEHDWGVVYLEENLAESLKDQIAALNKQPLLPVISIFPSRSTGEGAPLSAGNPVH